MTKIDKNLMTISLITRTVTAVKIILAENGHNFFFQIIIFILFLKRGVHILKETTSVTNFMIL